jgi:DNA-binding protein HU-beta
MTKKELIERIASHTDVPKSDIDRVLNALVQHVSDALATDDSIVLPGLGKFSVKQRAARTGRNPQTGEAIAIAACNVAVFKPAKALKDAIN